MSHTGFGELLNERLVSANEILKEMIRNSPVNADSCKMAVRAMGEFFAKYKQWLYYLLIALVLKRLVTRLRYGGGSASRRAIQDGKKASKNSGEAVGHRRCRKHSHGGSVSSPQSDSSASDRNDGANSVVSAASTAGTEASAPKPNRRVIVGENVYIVHKDDRYVEVYEKKGNRVTVESCDPEIQALLNSQ